MSMSGALNRSQIAWRVAQDIADGTYVNLGVGMPLGIPPHVPGDREVVFHSENGLLGFGPPPPEGQEDWGLVNAGKRPVTMLPGGAFFHHADSFAMIRGRHIGICVLGAYEVSEKGDLANWTLGMNVKRSPAVGGAMDLAAGARRVFVMCEHNSKDGSPKIVEECTLPLTGVRCVSRVYTDIAIVDVTDEGLVVRAKIEDMSEDELQSRTGAPIRLANDWDVLSAPPLEVPEVRRAPAAPPRSAAE
jgi:3-oxoadipate CoA-transferase beta subunit